MRKGRLLGMLCVGIALLFLMLPVQAYTTEVHVVKYASDETTVLHETTVNYTWMEANLPVYGDGSTHYYHQGPTFNESDPWDPAEYQNVESRDYGAVKGTNVKDLCELVGGMSPGDEIKIKAPDGFYKWFNYTNVYNNRANASLNSRQGPLVVCWYNGEESITGEPQGIGYPDTGYYAGMRLFFFADNGTNPWSYHVFGNWDMNECLAPKYWHNYSGIWPATSGLSVKWVSEIAVFSTVPPQIFDTGAPDNPYPSISGTHKGMIKLSQDINVSMMYTYPCSGTGGHTEYVRIENSSWNITANWTRYHGDWHNISFDAPFTLKANGTYNYTIITGSYPQIIHKTPFNATGGTINCTEFIDANGKKSNAWIPAIKLFW